VEKGRLKKLDWKLGVKHNWFLDRKIDKDKFDIQRQNRQRQIFREPGKLDDPFYNHGQKSWDKFALVKVFHILSKQSRANAISLAQPLPTAKTLNTFVEDNFSWGSTLHWMGKGARATHFQKDRSAFSNSVVKQIIHGITLAFKGYLSTIVVWTFSKITHLDASVAHIAINIQNIPLLITFAKLIICKVFPWGGNGNLSSRISYFPPCFPLINFKVLHLRSS